MLVERQRETFRRNARFRCPEHRICISPTTFAYESKWENLLWEEDEDRELLTLVDGVKRESRMERNNSEDAVTWNCFRHFQREGLLGSLMTHLGLTADGQEELIYWSYSPNESGECQWLVEARKEFGEGPRRSSEPDLILRNKTSIVFLEAKVTAPNKKPPSNPSETKDYLVGGEGWYGEVFSSSYDEVALRAKLYELMRFWLLGTWIANREGLEFALVNLVREGQETDIVDRFGQHIITDSRRRFLRTTWEDLFHMADSVGGGRANRLLAEYAKEKTLGYDQQTRKLNLAFSM